MEQLLLIHVFLLLSLSISDFRIIPGAASLGINYGQVGSNLPPPVKVISLIKSLGLSKARIYDTNPEVLTAFANSSIELVVTVENAMLETLADPQQAVQWVNSHIRPYYPATKITGIAVGNEVFTDDDTSLATYVVPAMVNIHAVLAELGFDSNIQVSSPSSLAVLAVSYPPSAGCFRSDLAGVMFQLLHFLQSVEATFWINAYPYFAYKDDPNGVSLDYALFKPNQGMVDPYTKLHYDNMLYAQIDAVIFAIARLGFNGVDVQVSETGWPSKGDPNEIGATTYNAAMYNRNLLRRQLENEGTPLRPSTRLDVYVFALFNEDLKPGPTSERNYGLFHPDCTMTYNIGLSNLLRTPSISSATVALTSSASKGAKEGYQSLVYWTFVYLPAFQVFMARRRL
ncbi:hypothetical protein Ancab_021400 [Ancistrocladus abbreviatus]